MRVGEKVIYCCQPCMVAAESVTQLSRLTQLWNIPLPNPMYTVLVVAGATAVIDHLQSSLLCAFVVTRLLKRCSCGNVLVSAPNCLKSLQLYFNSSTACYRLWGNT